MSGQVSAKTEDLEVFFTHGEGYYNSLEATLERVVAQQAQTRATTGHSVGTNSATPFRELLSKAVVNSAFVEEIFIALVNYGEGQNVKVASAEKVDMTLEEVGLAVGDVTFGEGDEGTAAEQLAQAAAIARARGDHDEAESLLAQAAQAQTIEDLIAAGASEQSAEVLAAGPPEMVEAVMAGEINAYVASQIPQLEPWLQDQVVSGEMSFAAARRVDNAGIADNEGVALAVINGDLTATQAIAMADYPNSVIDDVLNGDVSLELVSEVMSGPFAARDAAGDGDYDRAAVLTMSPEVQSAYTVGQYFDAIFDDDKINDMDDKIDLLAQPGGMDGLRDRIASEYGLEGSALDQAVADVEIAIGYYADPDNLDALIAMDDGNAKNPNNDWKAEGADAILRTAHLTFDSDSAAGAHVRSLAIEDYVADQGTGFSGGDLRDEFNGEGKLGEVTLTDQQDLMEAFVAFNVAEVKLDAEAGYPLPQEGQGLINLNDVAFWAERHGDDNQAFRDMAAATYADQAVDLQLGSPDDYSSNMLAAVLSASALFMYSPEDRPDFVATMDGVREVPLGDGTVGVFSESALFGNALSLDKVFDEASSNGSYSIPHFWFDYDQRRDIVAQTMEAMVDQAPPGVTLGDGHSNFVTAVFSTASPDAYRQRGDEVNPNSAPTFDTTFTRSMAGLLALNANPGDANAQESETVRLEEILLDPNGISLLTNTQGYEHARVDAETRSQLVYTTLFGRYETETLDSEVSRWTVEDFHDGTVEADYNVDVARNATFAMTGQPLTSAEEAQIREITLADQDKDFDDQLFGFNTDTNANMRAQLIVLALDHGWDADTIGETDNGWENPTVNQAYLERIAEVNINGGEPLTDEQKARLAEIVTDDNASRVLGLESEFQYGDMVRVLEKVIIGDWTVDTFNDDFGDGDLILNPALNSLFANDGFDLYSPDGAIGSQLVGLEGDTESFVFTALQIDPDGPQAAAARAIIDRIETEGQFADAASLEAVPVQLNFGDGNRGTIVLFKVLDENGKPLGLVDQQGFYYNDSQHWWKETTLPRAAVTVPTVLGGQKVSDLEFGHGDEPSFHVFKTEDFDGPGVFEYVVTGIGVVGGVVLIVGSAGTATPLVMGTGFALVATASGYQIIKSVDELQGHASRGGSYSLSDPYARGAWINIGANAFAIATAGTTALSSTGVRGFAIVGPNGVAQPTTAVTRFNRVGGWVGNAADGYDVWGIISNPDLSDGEKVWALTQMGLWAAPGFIASNLVTSNGGPTGPEVPNPDGTRIDAFDPASQGLSQTDFNRLKGQTFSDFLADYADTYPNGALSTEHLRGRFLRGERINPNGRSPKFVHTVEPPSTVRAPQVEGAELVLIPTVGEHPTFDAAAAARVNDPSRPELTQQQKVDASRALGEVGGEVAIVNFVTERFGPDAKLTTLDGQPIDLSAAGIGDFNQDGALGGTGQFDQAVLVEVDGQTYVLLNEAKGGSGNFSTRKINGQEFEQGTWEHTQSTLDDMADVNPEAAALIEDAIANGTLIYTTSRVALDSNGNVTSIRVNEFDVTGYGSPSSGAADGTVSVAANATGGSGGPGSPGGSGATTTANLADGPIEVDGVPFNQDQRLTAEQQVQVEQSSTFQTNGMATADINGFLATPQGQQMLDAASQAAPGTSDTAIYRRVQGWLESGVEAPTTVAVDEPLVKIVPTGESISAYSPYFAPLSALQAAEAEGVSLADYLGLPAGSHAPQYDLYVIMPVDQGAVGFESTIAPTTELDGLIQTTGGGTQIVVPDRSQFTEPVRLATLPESGPLPDIELPESVWELGPTLRGTVVQNSLGVTDYREWDSAGAEFGGDVNIDFVRGDNVVAVVSVDPASSTAQTRMERKIDALAAEGHTIEISGAVTVEANVTLDIRVPEGQAAELSSLVLYGQQQGITVQIVEFP